MPPPDLPKQVFVTSQPDFTPFFNFTQQYVVCNDLNDGASSRKQVNAPPCMVSNSATGRTYVSFDLIWQDGGSNNAIVNAWGNLVFSKKSGPTILTLPVATAYTGQAIGCAATEIAAFQNAPPACPVLLNGPALETGTGATGPGNSFQGFNNTPCVNFKYTAPDACDFGVPYGIFSTKLSMAIDFPFDLVSWYGYAVIKCGLAPYPCYLATSLAVLGV